jgi:acyl transferase domain-containing protein
MMLKKNRIPPNLNFINPKPSLHLDERGIKVNTFLCLQLVDA